MPKSEAPVLVHTKEAGTYMVEATPTESSENRLYVAKGLAEALPRRQFYVLVASTSNVPVSILKNMKIATLGADPSKVVPLREEIRVDPVHAVSIYKCKQSKERKFAQYQQVTKPNK